MIYTADAVTLYAFQDAMADGVFEADSLDAQHAKNLRIEFVSDDSGMAFLTDNGPEPAPPIEVQIIKAFPAIRTQQSGIWKDGGNQISVYIQLYETGSSVIVYTFDGAAFQVFLGDITLLIFNQLNLADQTEKLLMEFLGADSAFCEALPAEQAAYLPSVNSFNYIIEKLFFPMPLDVDFEGNPRSGTAPLTIQFNDISAVMHTDWFWDFGDSGTSTAKDPQHTYNDPGMYTVIMGASNGIIGTTSLYTDYIEVLSSGGPVISGTVAISGSGTPLGGVSLAFDGLGSAVTDGSGAYSMQVPDGWNGNVTPSLGGYTFTPPSTNYMNVTADETNQDYAATTVAAPAVTISGTVVFINPMSGVTVTLDNGGGVATTNASGQYSIDVPMGWSGTATPSYTGYTFTPSSIPYTNVTADQPNQDYTASYLAFIFRYISGHVAGAFPGTNLSGVTVTFSNGGGTATTDANGDYSHGVQDGWSGTATPSLSGHTFTPTSLPYANVTADMPNQDYTGFIVAYVFRYISGRIVEASAPFSPIPGVTVTFSGSGGGTTTTDTNGNYTFGVPSGWSGTATPSKSGRSFLPLSRPYNNVTADIGSQNYEGQ